MIEVLARLSAARVADAKDSGNDEVTLGFREGFTVVLEAPPAVMSCASVGGAADGVGRPMRWSPAGLQG